MEGPDGVNKHKSTKRKHKGKHFFHSPPARMVSLENAVPEVLEELEMDDYLEFHIQECVENTLYHITFQDKANGNKRMVLCVEYTSDVGDLLDDEDWEPELKEVFIVSREGIGPGTATMILESLILTLDDGWFDSDSEDSDDETLSLPSEPRTPPPRVSQPLAPPPLPRRRR